MKISFQQLLTIFYIVKELWNKLPIYQEVEKVSGNVLSKISAIPVYAFLV